MIRARLVAAAAIALVAAGCGPTEDGSGGGSPGASASDAPGAGPARIDVDTPQLRRMKRRAGVEACEPGDGEPVPGGLPELTLPCFGGGEDVELSSLRGPMVVNFWAVWCKPCRDEMPVLQAFHERYGDRVDVIGIDYEDVQVEAAMELVAETGVTYPLLADTQSELSGADPLPTVRGLPFLVLVDDEGRVAHQEFVEIESVEELATRVEEHLGVELS